MKPGFCCLKNHCDDGRKKRSSTVKSKKNDLHEIVELCKAESWPSFVKDPKRAWRALTAPGVITIVAIESGRVLGFAQMQADGEIQAHLSLILVTAEQRGQGIGTRLVQEAFKMSGAERIDVINGRDFDCTRSCQMAKKLMSKRL